MDTQTKLMIASAIPIMIAIVVIILGQSVNGQSIGPEKEVKTDITKHYFNGDKMTVIGKIINNSPVDIVVTDITLELYDIENNLIGVSSQYPYLVVAANDYGVWKITVTNNDVLDIGLIANVISDATYLNQEEPLLDLSNYT